MIIDLTVENLTSYRDPSTLSFWAKPLASNDKPRASSSPIARSVELIGEPGSGKSNFFHQWLTLKLLLLRSTYSFDKLPFYPYRYDKNAKDNLSRFEAEFTSVDARYVSAGILAKYDRRRGIALL